MILKKICLSNFRNYSSLELKFNKKINIFIGNNAQGKTNILEGIYVLSITKSHRCNKDLFLIKNGEVFTKIRGEIVFENSFNKTAMREGIVKCKVKNLRTGAITVEVLTGEKLEKVMLDIVKMAYSYDDGTNYVFMDNETYETIEIPKSKMQHEGLFLEEGTEVTINKYGDELLGVSLPDQVVCKVKEAEDAVQGNSVTNAMKKAWLESGHEINVPQFIKTGDKVIIDTETGKYVSRA